MADFRRNEGASIPLEEQLAQLERLGLAPCVDDFMDWILTEWPRDELEAKPYDLLLFSLGGVREENGQWLPLSNDIYCLDTECAEDGDCYANVFLQLRRIAKGGFDISEVTSSVNHDEKTASVSFTFQGQRHHWNLRYQNDWLDDTIFHRINTLLDVPADAHRFYIAQPDQSVQVVFAPRAQVEQLNILASASFLDTAFALSANRPRPASAAPSSQAKKERKPKEPLSAQIPYIGIACGLLLIALCCIWQLAAKTPPHETAVNLTLAFGFALLFVSMLLLIQQQKRIAQQPPAPAVPVALTEAEITAAMAVLAPTVTPYLALHTVQRPTGVYESKFGGKPYLPPDFSYPCSPESNTPLKLLCQLNFEQLPPLPDFPDHGILQFYISCAASDDPDCIYGLDFKTPCAQTHWRVVYHPALVTDETLLQSPPEFLPEQLRRFPLTDELALEATLSSMPLVCSDFRWEDFRAVWEKSAIAQQLDETYGQYSAESLLAEAVDKDVHKIGGYPNFAQDDARFPHYRDHTVLLLQMGSDHDIMWGDAGFANFFITPEALKQGDFSQVMYNWDCY